MAKYKVPKRPKLKKYPARPKKPKGGVKTDNQLKAWEEKVKTYTVKCNQIKRENDKKLSDWNKAKAAIEKRKKADKKAKDDFKKRVQKANASLNGVH
jgi:DNA repair exonuclease SbcCD ATPase subunit